MNYKTVKFLNKNGISEKIKDASFDAGKFVDEIWNERRGRSTFGETFAEYLNKDAENYKEYIKTKNPAKFRRIVRIDSIIYLPEGKPGKETPLEKGARLVLDMKYGGGFHEAAPSRLPGLSGGIKLLEMVSGDSWTPYNVLRDVLEIAKYSVLS